MNKNYIKERIHFIGAGGISMSALAAHALRDFLVSGSDVHTNGLTDGLKRRGAYIYQGSDPDIAASASAVVYNSAIKDGDIELSAAVKAGVPLFKRGEYLAKVASEFGKCAAVSGIHGKSTTTGLIAAILKRARMNFAAHIGAEVKDVGGNYCFFGRDIFVTEACEYKGSFLTLEPDAAIVLNVELDHPDCYENEEKVFENFRRFAERIKSGGALIVNADKKYEKIYRGLPVKAITFGVESGDFSARNMRRDAEKNRGYTFDFFIGGEFISEINNKLFGTHNVYNALAAAAAAFECGAGREDIIYVLENFGGVKRRFDDLGTPSDLGITDRRETTCRRAAEYKSSGIKLEASNTEREANRNNSETNNAEREAKYNNSETNNAECEANRNKTTASGNECRLISDYAHHPSEIKAVIKSAKQAFDGKIAVCFQPHTYSRTAKLFSDFLTCFDEADELILVKEYPARETPDRGKSAFELFAAIIKNSKFTQITADAISPAAPEKQRQNNDDIPKSDHLTQTAISPAAPEKQRQNNDGIPKSDHLTQTATSPAAPEKQRQNNDGIPKSVSYAHSIPSLKSLLKDKASEFSCVLLLGAGDMVENLIK
ncbi:MAG: Mur ligase domain-containing protein [Clostridiales bacterium]|nr:Mur ligase domain-containing protein [Clostridiales bacterium]